MAGHAHGTRRCYQNSCHCRPCRLAEAWYRSKLRRQQAEGRAILGQLVPSGEATRVVARLLVEHYSKRQLGRLLGMDPETCTMADDRPIRRKTLLKLRRGARILLGE